PNPTLSFGAGNFPIGRTNPPGIGAGDTVNEQVGIGQELVLWGKRGERIAAAHGRMAAAGAERADLDRRLVFEVRARFVRTLVAGERLRLARENLTHYRETVRVSRERADAGEISAARSATSRPSAEKDYLQAEEDAQKAAADFERARASLAPVRFTPGGRTSR